MLDLSAEATFCWHDKRLSVLQQEGYHPVQLIKELTNRLLWDKQSSQSNFAFMTVVKVLKLPQSEWQTDSPAAQNKTI